MSTNYYLQPPVDWPGPAGHIGKSSCGWAFSLHVLPERGIHDLEDWVRILKKPEACVRNEYGQAVSMDELLSIITQRGDPERLRRHEIDGYLCIGHGAGTWDLMIGEFS